jgi:hypothetical protein
MPTFLPLRREMHRSTFAATFDIHDYHDDNTSTTFNMLGHLVGRKLLVSIGSRIELQRYLCSTQMHLQLQLTSDWRHDTQIAGTSS